METSVGFLTENEAIFLRAVESEDPAPIDALRLQLPNGLIPVRAEILRRLVLRLKQPFEDKDEVGRLAERVVEVPKKGLELSYLEIIGQDPGKRYDETAALQLNDACTTEGHPLPPLALRNCVFHQTIYMSGAKFRNLDFRGSRLTRLKATNIRVEGNLNLSAISSSQTRDNGLIPVGDDACNLRGAQKLSSSQAIIQPKDYLRKCLPNEVIRALEPRESDRLQNPDETVKHEPLCWIELRNAWVGVDVDVSGSTLVCPDARSGMTNSPHAHYALDLRGSTINGRLTWSPDLRDTKSTRFTALGGVSIVRSRIAGSVCGSGGVLTAVEGCAFAAERAEIRGHVFLDFSWEGGSKWLRFEAEGFIDLTNATIGSTLYMGGASLGADRWQRSGLIASQATIGNNCELCGIERLDKDAPKGDELVRFESAGVRLNNATIKGALNMNGAQLTADSFDEAMYASGLTVHSLAEFSVLECSKNGEFRRFSTRGPVVMVAATFKKTLNFKGADLAVRAEGRETGLNECALHADLVQVQSTAYFNHYTRQKYPKAASIRTTVCGALSIQRAVIGMNLRMSGLFIDLGKNTLGKPNNRGAALDLGATRINGGLFLNAFEPKRLPGDTEALLFKVKGTVKLQQAVIGEEVFLEGAHIETVTDCLWGIKAYGAAIASKAGAFREVTLFDKAELSHLRELRVTGGIDLSHASIPRGLFLKSATVIAGDEPNVEEKEKKFPKNEVALKATMATISHVELQDSYIVGQVSLANLNAVDGLLSKNLTIKDGALDLLCATLGFLDLTGFQLIKPRPLIYRSAEDEDALHLRQARIVGKLTITRKGDTPPASGPYKPLLVRLTTWVWTRLRYLLRKPSQAPSPFYANLREAEIGGLIDEDGTGWQDLCLKLEGFICRRSPERTYSKDTRPRRGVSGHLYDLLQDAGGWTGLLLLVLISSAVVVATHTWGWQGAREFVHIQGTTVGTFLYFLLVLLALWLVLRALTGLTGILYWHFHMADAHVSWLNRQYRNWRLPSANEFTPSAYDQLAKCLREDGHDRQAKRVLSAKFRVKQKVDVATVSRPFWWFYRFGFDYGLSSLAAMSTLLLFLLSGCSASWYFTRGDYPLLVNSRTAHHCDAVDAALYSMEIFIPVVRLGEEHTCKIRPDNPPPVLVPLENANPSPGELRKLWSVVGDYYSEHQTAFLRLVVFGYLLAGWVVTSITLLTIPGILRSRADG